MFFSGFITGSALTFIGIVIYSCLVVASRADDEMEKEFEKFNK